MADISLIQNASIADLDMFFHLEKAAQAYPWSIHNLQDALHKYHCFKLIHHMQIIGFSVLQIIVDEAHLLNLTISPSYQQQGFGTKLLQFTLQQAQKMQACCCFLEVAADNLPAQKLYYQHDFNQIGIRRNYYQRDKNKMDAIIMVHQFLEYPQI